MNDRGDDSKMFRNLAVQLCNSRTRAVSIIEALSTLAVLAVRAVPKSAGRGLPVTDFDIFDVFDINDLAMSRASQCTANATKPKRTKRLKRIRKAPQQRSFWRRDLNSLSELPKWLLRPGKWSQGSPDVTRCQEMSPGDDSKMFRNLAVQLCNSRTRAVSIIEALSTLAVLAVRAVPKSAGYREI
ncbi:unnamed protein product [Cladocopium goreaui]|uniref:Uncharacterized protein n=1 Tax=Cladocopium goreaui TaxID=2562237 RepID=A0A9P1D5D8_9DINO|nr:unnamed protein product [Cladocopium goreaui]